MKLSCVTVLRTLCCDQDHQEFLLAAPGALLFSSFLTPRG
jgi:hypothetical protein